MFTAYHAMFAARCLLLAGQSETAIATSLSTARVDMTPHQVDAAIFALQSPLSRGVILADEVGLGKTIEASLVAAQRWAEKRRRILLIVPASLRKQWSQELREKFNLPTLILEARSYREAVEAGRRPFEPTNQIVLISYEFAAAKSEDLAAVLWDLVVFDEAHRLRNVYRTSGAKRAKKLRDSLNSSFKLLLTATPLQNSMMELYGLVSLIDDSFFGDETSFKLLYGSRPGQQALSKLKERLAPVYRRHLRRDVQAAGHVAFTERRVVTLDFEPADQEAHLYDLLSAYLRRPWTAAFGDPPNPLLLTVARKVLGSSTAAIIGFLETILHRLKERQALDLHSLADIDDIEALAVAATEAGAESLANDYTKRAGLWRAAPKGGVRDDLEHSGEYGKKVSNAEGGSRARRKANAPLDPIVFAAEIAEIEDYLALARSIWSTSKGEVLVKQLPALLNDVMQKGGLKKAVIFTESVRTQHYLAHILAENGHAGRIVLLNGSNADPESVRLYQAWSKRHAGTDAISGSRSADMKAAIIEAFKGKDTTILIATESGAEGINLQFCSLLINFDLPWNPQRVEQRIGRCHRYGQRLDVMVINFVNRRNKAEARVYELLSAKFKLFESMFGASDGVLGSIAVGVDFERAVLAIVQSCRTDEEIEIAFATLEKELDERIAADMEEARRMLFDHMDHGIVERLKSRGKAIGFVLGTVERHLLTVAHAELPNARFHSTAAGKLGNHPVAGLTFEHAGHVWTTDWATADNRGWRFFRLGDGELASELVERARTRNLSTGHVLFKPNALKTLGLPGYADVNRLKGRAGWLRVSCLTLVTPLEADRSRQFLVVAAISDDGEELGSETVEHLLCVPGEDQGSPGGEPPSARLNELERTHKAARIKEGEAQNLRWLIAENSRLKVQEGDLMLAAEQKVKLLNAQAKAADEALRGKTDVTPEEWRAERHRIMELERERDAIEMSKLTCQNNLRNSAQANLDRMAKRLVISPKLDRLFTLRWKISG